MENLKEGFRFSPTDAEAVTFLLRFIGGKLMDSSLFMWILTVNKNHGIFTIKEYPLVMTMIVVSIASSLQISRRKASRNVGNKGGSWKQEDKSKPVRKSSDWIQEEHVL